MNVIYFHEFERRVTEGTGERNQWLNICSNSRDIFIVEKNNMKQNYF